MNASVATKAAPAAASAANVSMAWEAKKEAERLKRKAEKRWTEIEIAIADLDIKVASLDLELCRPEIYATPDKSARLGKEKKEAESELAELYKELEELEAQGHGQ